MVDIIPITKNDWLGEEYNDLISPHASCRFHPIRAEFLAYAALDDDKPIGVLVARPIMRGYELEHLFVHPGYRQRGIARQMVDQFIEFITKNNELVLTMYIASDNPSRVALERIASGPGWFPPKKFLERYHHDVYALNPPWFERIPPLPANFEEFPWSELTTQDEALIRRRVSQCAIPPSVNPLDRDQARIEFSNSLGLRRDGELIAWMITHRVEDEMIRYSALYIDPRFRNKGLSIRLVVNAIRKQQASPTQWGYYEVAVKDTLPSWKRFVQRRIVPYVQDIVEVNMVWKKLQDS